jgi:hypothetical protein
LLQDWTGQESIAPVHEPKRKDPAAPSDYPQIPAPSISA